MVESVTNRGLRVEWGMEHRDGICELCNIPMVTREVEIDSEYYGKVSKRKVNRVVCPKCLGMKGRLIVKNVSIKPPSPPSCLSLKCLIKYFKDSLFFVLLSNYHTRRVLYAEAHRGEKILERYRIGQPSPQTIWQAIHANIKLKCPICRKYNVDPFLVRNK